jgi:hypothetical protein
VSPVLAIGPVLAGTVATFVVAEGHADGTPPASGQ